MKTTVTFVLVHGGWFGGWCWRDVADLLLISGHQVFTPTLTGLGERSHLATSDISLQTHAQDIANVLIYEDLYDVILVGHSYAGMPLTLVPALAPDRIRRLVYLDAFVPEHGQCLADIVDDVIADETAWLRPPPPLSRWGISDAELIDAIAPRLTPQPLSTRNDKVDLTAMPQLPKTYISLTRNQKPHFVRTVERLRASGADWDFVDLDAGHLVMLENPALLTDCFISLL